MQDVLGHIRECEYEEAWSEGMAKNGIGMAKLGSPIATCSMGMGHVNLGEMSREDSANAFLTDLRFLPLESEQNDRNVL